MQSTAKNVDQYLNELPADRIEAMVKLRKICLKELKGFEETMGYGMISYVVPLKTFPKGYHTTPNTPLPFLSIASQKNFIAFYHMGLYGSKELLDWFVSEYPKHSKTKLDMGKSCVRFKKVNEIPYTLLQELLQKLSLADYVKQYESIMSSLKK